MNRRDSSSSSSSDASPTTPLPLCIICGQAAVGLGPFSRYHLCNKHLSIDVADAEKLQKEVDERLRAYSQAAGAAGGVGALTALGEDVDALQIKIRDHLQQAEQRFDAVQRDLDSFRRSVTGPLESLLEALRVCKRDLEDVASYKREVATAKAAGHINEMVDLAQSMQLSLEDLEADFERAARLQREEREGAELQQRLLRQLERLVGSLSCGADATDWWRDAAVTARSEEIDAAERHRKMLFPMVFSHEVKLDDVVAWVVVCSDTSGFVGDSSGRVVPADSTSKGSEDLPQPCILASFYGNKDHLLVLSVDGSHKLRCHCDIDWANEICGLHCDRQLLFIAQRDAVTVTDLSGRAVSRIRPHIEGFRGICGIGGNAAASVFVSSGNKIAAFSKATGQMETVITLSQLPDARLGNLTIDDNCILVRDWKHNQVHIVRIDTQQVVNSHPTQRSGLKQFAGPMDVAVDSRGRLFVSEYDGHSVRAVAADDGSLLWTLGVPGESCSGDGRLNNLVGLAVVTGGPREQLVVADCGNSRLVVFSG